MDDDASVQIGWQSMSAAGGGGGMINAYARGRAFEEAVARETAARGEPDDVSDGRATWTRSGGGSTDRLELYRPDRVPGHVPLDGPIPEGAGHVRVEVSVHMPAPGGPTPGEPEPRTRPTVARRLAVFTFVVLAILCALGTLAAILWLSLIRGGGFC